MTLGDVQGPVMMTNSVYNSIYFIFSPSSSTTQYPLDCTYNRMRLFSAASSIVLLLDIQIDSGVVHIVFLYFSQGQLGDLIKCLSNIDVL